MRLKLGDKEFEMKPLTLNDWIEAEEMGLDMNTMQKGSVKLKDFRTICYIAIKKVDTTITEEWIGERITLSDTEIFNQIASFMSPNEAKKK